MHKNELKIIFSTCILALGLFLIHMNFSMLQNSRVEFTFTPDIIKYLHDVCHTKNQTVLILIENYGFPVNFSAPAGLQVVILNELTNLTSNLPLVISFLRNHDCIEKVIVLNSDSIIFNNYQLLRAMEGSPNNLNNVILNSNKNQVKLLHILHCFYMYDHSGGCRKTYKYSTCEHSPAIIQYLYHSSEDVANGQPSLTIVFEEFNAESILNSDFLIMKAGLENSKFLINYHSPSYKVGSNLSIRNAFPPNIVVAGETKMDSSCKMPFYRSRPKEELFYTPPDKIILKQFDGLDAQSTQCNLTKKFSEINFDLKQTLNFLLIAEFRYKQYYKRLKNIFEILYRPFFKHILYCGPHILNNSLFENVSRINTSENNGVTSYDCLVKAVRLGYQVDGYLLLSDDVALQYWNFEKLNVSGLYMQRGIRRIQFNNTHDSWGHWNKPYGIQALKKAIFYLEHQHDIEVRNFLSQYKENMQETGVQSYSDFVYLPNKFSSTYMKVGEVLARYGVFLEIATPFIFHGLDKYDKIEHNENYKFYQTYSAKGIRQSDASKLTYDSVVFHPIKFSKVADNNSIYSLIFCKYIKHLQSFLERLGK